MKGLTVFAFKLDMSNLFEQVSGYQHQPSACLIFFSTLKLNFETFSKKTPKKSQFQYQLPGVLKKTTFPSFFGRNPHEDWSFLPFPWPSTEDLGDYDVKTLYLGACHESSSPLQQDPGHGWWGEKGCWERCGPGVGEKGVGVGNGQKVGNKRLKYVLVVFFGQIYRYTKGFFNILEKKVTKRGV